MNRNSRVAGTENNALYTNRFHFDTSEHITRYLRMARNVPAQRAGLATLL